MAVMITMPTAEYLQETSVVAAVGAIMSITES
jgi:hypothetical protein